jgi:predicted deacylase
MPSKYWASLIVVALAFIAMVQQADAQATTPLISEIGRSANGLPIEHYQFGNGDRDIVLVGGIHGGYEWNTTVLAYAFIDYFRQHPSAIPDAMTVHIIPNANPDGLYMAAGKVGRFLATDISADGPAARFNGHGVDLNRNWDCRWTEQAVWRNQPVSAGPYPFSEPESVALRDFFMTVDAELVLLWHSAAGAVYAGGCPDPHSLSLDLATRFAQAAGYPVFATFEHYDVTGDASDWLITQDIPSFTVELTTHDALDWEQNLAGVMRLLAPAGLAPRVAAQQWLVPSRLLPR